MPQSRERPATRLLQRAVALLARREHSRAQLARKLTERLDDDQASTDIDGVLDELQRRGLLSEERFAASVVRVRAARYGDARLAQDLKERGVPAEVARAALDTVRGSEVERARQLWLRRFGTPPASLAERVRQSRYLTARGFSAAVIRKVLTGLPDDDPGD
jgi:regulatory protein